MTDSELLKLLEVAEKATPGPWEYNYSKYGRAFGNDNVCEVENNVGPQYASFSVGAARRDSDFPSWRGEANAAHIAAFNPTTCAALVREVLRLREDLRILTKGRFVKS